MHNQEAFHVLEAEECAAHHSCSLCHESETSALNSSQRVV